MKQVQELINLLSETHQKLKELIDSDEYEQKLIKKIKEEYNIEIKSVIYSYGNTWINLWDGKHNYVYWPGSDKFCKG